MITKRDYLNQFHDVINYFEEATQTLFDFLDKHPEIPNGCVYVHSWFISYHYEHFYSKAIMNPKKYKLWEFKYHLDKYIQDYLACVDFLASKGAEIDHLVIDKDLVG